MVYLSSNTADGSAAVLWERAEDAIPADPDLNEPLAHIGLRCGRDLFA